MQVRKFKLLSFRDICRFVLTDQSLFREGGYLADSSADEALKEKRPASTGKIGNSIIEFKGDMEYADGTTDGL
jgi:hypothetical protein